MTTLAILLCVAIAALLVGIASRSRAATRDLGEPTDLDDLDDVL